LALSTRAACFSDNAIDRHERNAQGSCCGCRALTRRNQIENGAPVDARFSACVDTGPFRACNALRVEISARVGFELREDRQHSEEGATCRCRGIDALLENAQMGASILDLVGDVGEVSQRPAEPIQSRG
jgi:hypothetical protein